MAVFKIAEYALICLFLVLGFIGFAWAARPEEVPIGVAILYYAILPVIAGSSLIGGLLYRKATMTPDLYRVWYGTNRAWLSPGDRYSATLSPNTQLGSCLVAIPRSHKFGSLGSSGMRHFFAKLFTGGDDRLTLKEVQQLDSPEFIMSIKSELAKYDDNSRSALVYIHGFNTSFEEAALRAAQIGFDLKIQGVMAFFSWPSRASGPLSYASDEDAIAASEDAFTEFLLLLGDAVSNARLHILAHSMGNRGLLRALHSSTYQAQIAGLKLGQIFLAAPDIDVALFRRLAHIFPKVAENSTLYISSVDKALDVSVKLHQNQRLGYCPPVTVVEGVHTVEVTTIDIGFLGHSYYAEAAGVLFDMWTLLRSNVPPDQRPALVRAVTPAGSPYWTIRAPRS
jgi:esterase/lipase superfamily enzyme